MTLAAPGIKVCRNGEKNGLVFEEQRTQRLIEEMLEADSVGKKKNDF